MTGHVRSLGDGMSQGRRNRRADHIASESPHRAALMRSFRATGRCDSGEPAAKAEQRGIIRLLRAHGAR